MKLSYLVSTFFLFGFSALFFSLQAQTVTPTAEATPTIAVPTSTTIPTAVAPATPQNLKATAIDEDRIDLSWQQVTGANSYEIYRNNEMIAIVGALIYSDTGLAPETSYSYKVRAYNGASYSAFSTTVSATTKSLVETELPQATTVVEEETEDTPSLQEAFSIVTVDGVTYKWTEIPDVEMGVEFIIMGRSEDFADIELSISSITNSYFVKANDDGFWEVSVDTEKLQPGVNRFMVTVEAEGFEDVYQSDEFSFEVLEAPEVTETETAEPDFGSTLNRVIIVVIVLLLILAAVALGVAYKKGLFKKITGKDKEGDNNSGGSNGNGSSAAGVQIGETTPTNLENMIKIEEEVPHAPEITAAEHKAVSKTDAANSVAMDTTPESMDEDLPVSDLSEDPVGDSSADASTDPSMTEDVTHTNDSEYSDSSLADSFEPEQEVTEINLDNTPQDLVQETPDSEQTA